MNPTDLVKKSKHLSKILRHSPESAGIKLDPAGWTPVDPLLEAVKLTREELEVIVRDNNKKRFEFSADALQIRASQGHSVEVDLGYEERMPPAWLYHGTSIEALPAIKAQGLLKMNRHHVHLSEDQETAKQVAKRRKGPVLLSIQAGLMYMIDDLKFFKSTNGVWLVDRVPSTRIVFPKEV